jgi:hypothetical protein
MRIFRIARAYGLNHLRFHSWCPPEAAFIAADHTGFYLQVECGSWANSGAEIGSGSPLDGYLYEESERIVASYGNHPSFCFMLYGNEPAGAQQEEWLTTFIRSWQMRDQRRLYSGGAGWPLLAAADFNSTPDPRIQRWGEGLNSLINAHPPQSEYDWLERLPDNNNPTVSHEIGQWCAYPDLKEIDRYTGVLKARNFEIFRESLTASGLIHLADSFLLASGKLQTLCYKADIEAALRTPGFGGFQLLDLHDFPGQGTALVGVLNAFWEGKGYVAPEEYRKFCCETVPLLRMEKMTWLSGDTFTARAEIAHFGPTSLANCEVSWQITNEQGEIRFSGKWIPRPIVTGDLTAIGSIEQPLAGFKRAEKLVVTLRAGNFVNSWDLWVYPDQLIQSAPNVYLARKLDAKAEQLLKDGGKVLLMPIDGSVKPGFGGEVAVGFSSIFWNTAWTGRQPPHTLGILCNPRHRALADFPTEYHSNWQWWAALHSCQAFDLSKLPGASPVVRLIDDWFTNRPLALIAEARVERGSIVICGADLQQAAGRYPEARQLLNSLLVYMNSGAFSPESNLDCEILKASIR